MNETTAVRALAALAQTSRLQVFRALIGAGPQGLTPSALSQALGIAPSALSFHLKELTQAELVTQEREGRHLIYRPSVGAMNGLIAFLTDHCCEGQPCGMDAPRSCAPPNFNPEEETFMTPNTRNVLFICTGNSARSILAEVILNQLGAGRFHAYSAGSHPSGVVNPRALDLLERNRFKVGALRSKNWDEFARPDAPRMDFVLTVCDKAAGEVCPVWPGQPISAHWGVPDPAAATGTAEQVERAFQEAFAILNRRISLFVTLPMEKLDRLALQQQIAQIGQA